MDQTDRSCSINNCKKSERVSGYLKVTPPTKKPQKTLLWGWESRMGGRLKAGGIMWGTKVRDDSKNKG